MIDVIAAFCTGLVIGLGPIIVLVFIKPKRAPMDSSNRIGHLRLVWFALKHPHKFVELYFVSNKGGVAGGFDPVYSPAFPWLTKDEGDIVEGVI